MTNINQNMTRHKMVVRRNALGQIAASNTIGTDASNAVSTIPGVIDVRIEVENDEQVEISYSYTLNEKFQEIVRHLAKFNLERADW
jgi:hypothetical protein